VTVQAYTTKLQAGLGLIPETERLLHLWEPGMNSRALLDRALDNGDFPSMTARRLRNVISEGFAPRYLVNDNQPATALKLMQYALSKDALKQIYFLYTSRANPILADFVRDIYWQQYVTGAMSLTKMHAINFVEDAVANGKTTTNWSETTRTRVSSYLLGACADFGLLGKMEAGSRKIETFRPSSVVSNFLAHELHFSGLTDNAVLNHKDWHLLGLRADDALVELKQIAIRGEIILQSAAGLVQISWKHKNIEEMVNAVTYC